jgi:hypothetical protein
MNNPKVYLHICIGNIAAQRCNLDRITIVIDLSILNMETSTKSGYLDQQSKQPEYVNLNAVQTRHETGKNHFD